MKPTNNHTLLRMRIFLTVLVLIFSLQSWTKAEDISEFEIEGITVFSNLLDHAEKLGVTKEFILKKKFKFYPNSARIALLRFKNRGTFQIYDSVQFQVDSKNYKIYTITGILGTNTETKEKCLKKQDEAIEALYEMAPSAIKIVDRFSKHPADKTGKSISNGIYLDLPSGDTLSAECYIWGEEFKNKGYDNNLKVNIESKEGRDFIQTEAYKPEAYN